MRIRTYKLCVAGMIAMGLVTTWTLLSVATRIRSNRAEIRVEMKIHEAGGFCIYDDYDWETEWNKGFLRRYKRPHIRVVVLRDTVVSDAIVASLKELDELEVLDFEDSVVSARALAGLATCRSLSSLNLNGSSVGDACIPSLCAISSLATVSIEKTAVSTEAVLWLCERRPLLRVVHSP